MSATRKTEHYNLPQFDASDVTSWLGDFNPAMTAIDTGMWENKSAADSAAASAMEAKSAAEAAKTAAETAKTAADSALSVADSAVDMFSEISISTRYVPVTDTGSLGNYVVTELSIGNGKFFLSFPRFHIGTTKTPLGGDCFFVGKSAGKVWDWLPSVTPVAGTPFVASTLGVFRADKNAVFSLLAYYNGSNTIFMIYRAGGIDIVLDVFSCPLTEVGKYGVTLTTIPT